jgi:hypothetical protein
VQHAIAEHRRRGRTQQERFFSEEALRLERAELLLMMTHRERFHGPVLGQVHSVDQQTYLVDLFRLEWRLGFVHGAWLPRSPRRDGLTVELWRALLELSSARYLRRATLDWADLDQLTAPPATLRRIDVVLDSWWPSELEEQARRADLEVTPLEQLVGPPEDHADALLKELNPLLEGEATGLRELALQRCRCSRRLLEALLASPLLPRLETLDLSRGNLSDDDLPLLQQRWPTLTHLRQLDLERNRFSRQGRGALHALGENVVVKPGGVRG